MPPIIEYCLSGKRSLMDKRMTIYRLRKRRTLDDRKRRIGIKMKRKEQFNREKDRG